MVFDILLFCREKYGYSWDYTRVQGRVLWNVLILFKVIDRLVSTILMSWLLHDISTQSDIMNLLMITWDNLLPPSIVTFWNLSLDLLQTEEWTWVNSTKVFLNLLYNLKCVLDSPASCSDNYVLALFLLELRLTVGNKAVNVRFSWYTDFPPCRNIPELVEWLVIEDSLDLFANGVIILEGYAMIVVVHGWVRIGLLIRAS